MILQLLLYSFKGEDEGKDEAVKALSVRKRAREIFSTLCSIALIDLDRTDMYSVHRLVQEAQQHDLAKRGSEAKDRLAQCCIAVARVAVQDVRQSDWEDYQATWAKWYAHIAKILASPGAGRWSVDYGSLAFSTGCYLETQVKFNVIDALISTHLIFLCLITGKIR